MLTLYNTKKRQKQAFVPHNSKLVGMYVCGPTVYDLAHIGNARPIIVFDVLYRLLRYLYGSSHVKYVRNITDVDDKINSAAKLASTSIESITNTTIKAFHEDIAELNVLVPDIEPRATQHIPEMIEMISDLIISNHAYEVEGHVLFHVPSYTNYGKLSRRSTDEMIAGARIEIAPYKRNAADFILWKPSSDDLPGWESPWGRGRPGWHIECSAMSRKHLGNTVDIHGGGIDLIFPHHENEIAQSECSCTDEEFVRYWVHNGFLSVDGQKMSKSLGNFITIRSALGKAPGEVLRLMMLNSHYRKPLNWTNIGIEQAKETIKYIYNALWLAQQNGISMTPCSNVPKSILEALTDDIHTPLAVSSLHSIASKLYSEHKKGDRHGQAQYTGELLAAGGLLGILQYNPSEWFQGKRYALDINSKQHALTNSLCGDMHSDIDETHILSEIELRNQARKMKDFQKADQIRDNLAREGILLEDRSDGTTVWRLSD